MNTSSGVLDLDLIEYTEIEADDLEFIEELALDEDAANDDFCEELNENWVDMPAHPATAIFPEMSEAEFKEFKADIAQNGLRQPILVYRNQVIDGRQRLRACKELGFAPRYKTVDVTEKR